MKIFDSHAHYDDDRYDGIREELMEEMEKNGVDHIVNCGSSREGMRKSIELSREFPIIYAAVGIHPSNADEYTSDTEKELKEFLKDGKTVAVGEIGLDYYWEDNPSKELQMEVLKSQVNIARDAGKPVIYHIRDAYGDMMDFLRKNSDVPGVLHSFSGSPETAGEVVSLGYYLGVGGVVTFKNAKKLPEVIFQTPIDRLLTETDAPYLTPVPYRGKTNRSDFISYVVDAVASIKGLGKEETAEILYENSMKFFGL